MGIAAGGHVRVGIEDNKFFDRGNTELADNVRMIKRIAGIAREMGREPASPDEARRIIGITGSKEDYKKQRSFDGVTCSDYKLLPEQAFGN
jgi:3-keto-5-aminohexanoate cleavage enzyme